MSGKDWGGAWTERKLDAFEKYVNAYLTIMNAHRDKYGWKLIYFDGFAGSGDRKNDRPSELYNEMFPDENVADNAYKGAAERVLNIKQRGFDYYYFIDRDKKANGKLEQKLNPQKADGRLVFRFDDANEQITKLSDVLKKNYHCRALVLLDPFGMQINWSAIETLKGTNADLWILFSVWGNSKQTSG